MHNKEKKSINRNWLGNNIDLYTIPLKQLLQIYSIGLRRYKRKHKERHGIYIKMTQIKRSEINVQFLKWKLY